MITGTRYRAARALVELFREKPENLSKIVLETIKGFE